MTQRLFGTDGIRGPANRHPVTAEMGLQLGRAVVRLCRQEGWVDPPVVLGRDTRVSGGMLEHAVAAGVAAEGGRVLCAGILPTPGTAFLTRALGAAAGIVISASHNPYTDNGFKVFSAQGYKLSGEAERRVERMLLGEGMDSPEDSGPLGIVGVEDAVEQYVEFLCRSLPGTRPLAGLTIALDCAHGATYQAAPALFTRLGARIHTLFARPTGRNINRECGSEHPGPLQEAVKAERAALGLAFDGDGDRLRAVDETGAVLTGDQIMAICSRSLLEEGRLDPPVVVSTVMSNLGLRAALADMGIGHVPCPVGDRHVVEAMLAHRAVLGGEESGHIVFLGHHTTGDGLLTALQLLHAMRRFGKPLSRLAQIMTVYPQVLLNVPVTRKPDLETLPAVEDAVREVRDRLGERARILLRYSGTEPVCRVMVEGKDPGEIRRGAQHIARAVAGELGPEQGRGRT